MSSFTSRLSSEGLFARTTLLWQEGDWANEWQGNGMLKSVKRPDGETVSFEYDPLGRRISKTYQDRTTRWVWDGNVPLHEWTDEEDITTWVFEEGSFVPCAKLQNGESYSIITDYLGTPTEMYNSKGKKTWSAELDIYGCVRTFRGRSLSDCPFRYQGQYEDEETGLYYNRFRYYDPNTGTFISQDPIGLAGNNPTLYGYVKDTNNWIDSLGLLNEFGIAGYGSSLHVKDGLTAHELLQNAWLRNNGIISSRMSGIAVENPAMALQEQMMHKTISRLQAEAGLHKPSVLRSQTALENIEMNAEITRRGIYEDLVNNRGWESENAKGFAARKARELKEEAIDFAKKNNLINH
ncbi:RHS repeat domain-containing protein [Porphyromonas macacae]|uniref:RHS repeat domain-containing protein n=1 Tax=Porphyromonas macacae TaxID=28115 RepID=UPI00351EDFA0